MLPLVLEDAIVHLFLTRLLKVPRNNPVFKRSGPFSSFPSFSTATKSRQSHQSNPFQNRQQQKTGVNWQQSRLTKYSQSISAKKKERRKDKKIKHSQTWVSWQRTRSMMESQSMASFSACSTTSGWRRYSVRLLESPASSAALMLPLSVSDV